jgi:hypothetical protein
MEGAIFQNLRGLILALSLSGMFVWHCSSGLFVLYLPCYHRASMILIFFSPFSTRGGLCHPGILRAQARVVRAGRDMLGPRPRFLHDDQNSMQQ